MAKPPGTTTFESAYGNFALRRYPHRSNEILKPWCSADNLLLNALAADDIPASDALVVNDAHGALCTAVQPMALWTDSALTLCALRANEVNNARIETRLVTSTEQPPACAIVILRVPKQRSYFEYQLSVLGQLLPDGARVMAAGMDKHLSQHTASLLENYIGPTQRHRGESKARMFTATRDGSVSSDYTAEAWYDCDLLGASLCTLPNVFSREGLDQGARFLLESLTRAKPVERLIDLASGNGVLGLWAYKNAIAGHVTFCDESAQAIESCKKNVAHLHPENAGAFSFNWGDGLKDYSGERVGRILCNPPFHSDHAVDELAGRQLLDQCAEHLLEDGDLWVVANRHLDYKPTLRRSFKQVEQMAQNKKFAVLRAVKT